MNTTYIQNSTILVIDDTQSNLDVLNNCLTEAGAKVLMRDNGKEGIALAIEKKPDIILLDIVMTHINGYEVCQLLKAEPLTHAIPVIFTSALTRSADKIKGFSVGGVDYITKPFQLDEIIARIEIHLVLVNLQQQLEIKNQQLEQEIKICRQIAKNLENANQRLHRLSISDGLTNIANRRHFDSYLKQEWQRAMRDKQPIALLIADIDYFKQYNDTYGHQGGDRCLIRIAQAMTTVVKRPSDLVARYGGEEFAIILPNTEMLGAIEIGKKICQTIIDLKIPHTTSLIAPYVTVSLGINFVTPTNDHTIIEFIEIADRGLYQAKEQGRNRIVVSKKMS